MSKRVRVLLIVISLVFILVGLLIFKINNKPSIKDILKTEAYSYLPKEAKEYVEEVYKSTGNVVLTEKNKEENKVYLNPEYINYITLSSEEKQSFGEIPSPMTIDYSPQDTDSNIELPSSYDLSHDNDNSYVTPIRDQGDLGLCWTFASAGALESHLLKMNDTPYTQSSKLISERQIDYATSRDGIRDYKNEQVAFINRSLGDGGNFYISTFAFANGISGVEYNNFKEYDDKDLSRMELSEVLSYDNSSYELDSTKMISSVNLRESTSLLTDDEISIRNDYLNLVKRNILENGAAYVATYMNNRCGYTDTNLNNFVIDVYNCNLTGGHAMEIIGWDDNIEYSYCADTKTHNPDISNCNNVVSGKGVWILKNSWGDTKPNPYLTYDSKYTDIGFINNVVTKEDKNWDNSYTIGTGIYDYSSKMYELSDTKIKNNEKLEKIKFIAENYNSIYNISIVKNNQIEMTFEKEVQLPGLITINVKDEVENDIVIDEDTKIVIHGDNEFIDRISIFTSNIEKDAYIDFDQYNNTTPKDNKFRIYSDTKNIPSNAIVTYKLYNSNEEDISNMATFTNNVVAENNINTYATLSNELDEGQYRIDAIYNSNVINSFNFNNTKMQGLGTEDNPYIITNSVQLSHIKYDLDAYYELANDIDLTQDTSSGGILSLESTICPQGFGWEAINNFSGSLDGKGHTIKGLYQNNYITCNNDYEESWYAWNNRGNGLFGKVRGNATIKNLILEDFDITCQGGYCGALVSDYTANYDENGEVVNNDNTEYTATFENIAIKNSKISGKYNPSNIGELQHSYGGGLFGYLLSLDGNINISNIYVDIFQDTKELTSNALLIQNLQVKNANIKNIQLENYLMGKYSDGSGDAVMIYEIIAHSPQKVSIKNVLSTVKSTNTSGLLFNKYYGDNLTLDGVNILGDENIPLSGNNQLDFATNVNIYNGTNLLELTKASNYETWEDFEDNWEIKEIDGIKRIPTLKFMDFDYTNILDISLNQVLNEYFQIYDYINPDITSSKMISYKSNDEDIVSIDEEGYIIPKSTGSTTIHIESSYDGYVKDVPINITYVPHYNVEFDSNGGTGNMDYLEVSVNDDCILPKNKFEKENYEFIGWNTEADGSGTAYLDESQIEVLDDKETITLYAQWLGEKRVVTFDADGGTVNPEKKTVRYNEKYGELPIPKKAGYGFVYWEYRNTTVNANSTLNGLKLTASYKEDAYTIIYNGNKGKISESNVSGVKIMSDTLATTYANNNSDKVLNNNFYVRDGYTFKEWNTKADGSGTSYQEEEIINLNNVENSELNLYAIWDGETIEKSIVTFHSNYEPDTTKNQEITNDTDTQLVENTFERENYKFIGWNTEVDGTGTPYLDEAVINIIENIDLYAQWQEIVDDPDKLKVSIMGDSVSTYYGISVKTSYYPEGDVDDPSKTWWSMAFDELNLELGSNMSWSGSTVNRLGYYTGDTSDTTRCYYRDTIPATKNSCFFSDYRVEVLGLNGNPDIIIIYGGSNDANFSSTNLGSFDDTTNNDTTIGAFYTLISKIKTAYPKAKLFGIVPSRLPRTGLNKLTEERWNEFHSAFIQIYENHHIPYTDLDTTILKNVYGDYGEEKDPEYFINGDLHPTYKGMQVIKDKVVELLNTNVKINFYRNYDSDDTQVVSETFNIKDLTRRISTTFEKQGYNLLGWNTNRSATVERYDKDNIVYDWWIYNNSGEVNLYAIWEEIPIEKSTVTFHSNYESDTTSTQEIKKNADTNLSKNTFEREGYTFTGWNTKSDGTGNSYDDESIINLNEDTDLYAQWVAISFNIVFNPNGATGVMSNQKIYYDVTTKLQKNLFTKEGYTFTGWNTASDGSGTSYTDEQSVKNLSNVDNSNITLYAQWEEINNEYEITGYEVDNTNNYISKIIVNTTKEEFKNSFNLPSGYTVEVETKKVDNKDVLYTGGKTKIYNGNTLVIEFTNVVVGDINGDGQINSADLLRQRQHLLNIINLSGIYFLASDINYDNQINSADLLRTRQHLLGIKPIGKN